MEEDSSTAPEKTPKLHPTVKATGFVSFFTDMGSEIIYPILPMFLVGLKATRATIGLIEGLAEGVPTLVRLVSGYISDRVRSRKWMILFGYSISTVFKPLIGLARASGVVLLFRLLDRLGKGIRTAPRDALVADCSEETVRGYSFGFQRAMDHAGAVLGALIAFTVLWVFQLDAGRAILLAFFPGLLAVLTIILFVKEKPGRRVIEVRGGSPVRGVRLLPRSYFFYILGASFFALANSTDAFLLLRSHGIFESTGLANPLALTALLWALLNFAKSATSLWGGKFSDRIGRMPVLVVGWLLYSFVYVGFAYAEAWWAPWVLFVLYGAFFGMTEGSAKAVIADIVPEGHRGTAFGFWSMLEGLLLIIASVVAGALWDITGSHTVPLLLCGVLSFVGSTYIAVWAGLGGFVKATPEDLNHLT